MGYIQDLGEQVGSNAAGGIMDIAFGGIRNKQQREQNWRLQKDNLGFAMEMGRFNTEQQMKMWNETNAEAQMKHLKEAGLNPSLIYGGGGAGGSTTAGGGGMGIQGATAQVQHGGGMNILMPAQVELMKAQARNLDADTAKKAGVETDVLTTDNELKKIQLQINKATTWEQINEITSRSIEQQEKGLIAGQQRTIGEETVNNQIDIIKQTAINKLIESQVMQQGIKLSEAQIQKMAADIVQRGRELDIQEFIAEINANQPEVGKVLGGAMNNLKEEIQKILGMGKDVTRPKQIKK